jgi:hypothetical protein
MGSMKPNSDIISRCCGPDDAISLVWPYIIFARRGSLVTLRFFFFSFCPARLSNRLQRHAWPDPLEAQKFAA